MTEDESFYTNLTSRTLTLSLSSPADQSILSTPTVTISGTTSSKAVVLISGGASDVSVDSDGSFSLSYTLLEGTNELSIEAIDADGRQDHETRIVFYTKENVQ